MPTASAEATEHSTSADAGADPEVAFFYEDDAHREPDIEQRGAAPDAGLFGRHVANSEFLRAWLARDDWQRLVALIANQASGETLARRFKAYPAARVGRRELELVPLPHFHERFLPNPPARVLHFPQPVDPELGWVRQHRAPHAFALSGVTHTISSKGVMNRLHELVSGPFEPYDTLFCISRAALDAVRRVTENYATYLRERFGGNPTLRPRLVHVPFGVDTERFRPATLPERSAARSDLGVVADALCVLFVGRLSYASKVHPFPLFRATAEAARRTGRRVHLILAGWAESPSVLEKFKQGAQALAPGIHTTFVDGMHPDARVRVWKAADVFLSLSDNVQETLGLTLLEAQASGLPVVTSDWDGCRDSIEHGTTGFLVPARMVAGATRDGTSRHLSGETSYGAFLGETNQTVAVDAASAAGALERLFTDAPLRAAMGQAARARALAHFTWPGVLERYRSVWREQEAVRREHAQRATTSNAQTPVLFPDVEFTFGAYPSAVLDASALVTTAPDAEARLDTLLTLPLTNYVAQRRVAARTPLVEVLAAARTTCELASLFVLLERDGTSPVRARATLAWLLKYDLLRVGG